MAACDRWLSVTGGICILSLLLQCLEMLFTELIHPVFTFLNVRIIILSRTHPYRQNLPARDASTQDFSSLQAKSSHQGCIDPGFFIPTDKIFSSGMHRPGIFHPCRQNLPVRDASPPQLYPRFPSAPAVRRARLNSPQRLPGTPDKADSSDFQTAGFRSR